VDAVHQASERSGERMIVCELPDDPPFTATAAALEASGYAEEGRVPDFVRDGVALRLLVQRLAAL
jgi:predicted GNAT superfamily acetyltransferase